MKLNKLIKKYLKQNPNKIIFADNENSYTNKAFKKKIHYYKKIIQKEVKKYPKNKSKNIGFAIYLNRGIDYFSIIFACWLSNCFYLPLSKETKKKFINYQLKTTNVVSVFKKKNSRIIIERNKHFKNTKTLFKKKVKKLAYIMFTSGSTGVKKGVAISRFNLESYMKSIRLISKDKFAFNSLLINGELIFDISIGDIVFALLFKSKIIITSESTNLISLFNLLNKHQPEAIYAVPSTWEKIIDYGKKFKTIKFNSVKQINSGGEALHKNLVKKMISFFPRAKILNVYGPTEFVVNATYFPVNKKTYKKYNVMPIGKSLPEVECLVLKNNKKDKFGELLLRGNQKMEGYINAKVPLIKIKSKYYFPTGDLVFKDKNKNINFYGRKSDYQKISGYRINLASLEQIIRKKLHFKICLISKKGKIYLFIFFKKIKKNIIKNKLYKIFDKYLEKYEIPSNIYYLKNMPLNSSGKLDKNKLRKMI